MEDTYEAGLQLFGSEVKSIRLGHVNLRDSFVIVKDGEAYILGMHVTPYERAGTYGLSEAKRERKLLLHKKEVEDLRFAVQRDGYTLIATKLYFKESLIKVELAVCRGKQKQDKRQALKEKDAKREMERAKHS